MYTDTYTFTCVYVCVEHVLSVRESIFISSTHTYIHVSCLTLEAGISFGPHIQILQSKSLPKCRNTKLLSTYAHEDIPKICYDVLGANE